MGNGGSDSCSAWESLKPRMDIEGIDGSCFSGVMHSHTGRNGLNGLVRARHQRKWSPNLSSSTSVPGLAITVRAVLLVGPRILCVANPEANRSLKWVRLASQAARVSAFATIKCHRS